MLQTNLSTRPFYSERAVLLALAVVALAVLALTVSNVQQLVALSKRNTELGRQVAAEFPRVTFFAGYILFQRERWYQRLLHNETAFAIQRRLQWAGMTMVILPARVT